ncbi:DUF3404 domain-containing protein [Chromobacterium phragmitis]|uniref:Histidine kinase VxrA sensor domain-containing protein n=1 Tax=Chromobacterium phragmitis TaxID=2202141 RepID=A0A344UM79_9NEIS|nr:DUF3404 domain-containing protein [Chromobacterium phragmitis]AXE36377.1 hypothetical protein DK843_20025 [Chromobacterium phragmitis]
MPRLFALFLFAVCLPARADVAALEAALRAASAQAETAVAPLQQLDAALLRPDSLYPALGRLPLAQLQALYRHRGQCGAPWPALPADALRFERALCAGAALPPEWFAAHPIHPLGGSYAWHYLQRRPESASALQPYLHVRERPAAFAGIGKLSDDNLAALLAGERWLLDDDALWRRDGAFWRRYAPEQWRPLAEAAGLALSPLADGDACPQALGRICARPLPPSPWWWRLAAGLPLLAAAGVLAYGWLQRRRLERERRFVLQMLTHELRTPSPGWAMWWKTSEPASTCCRPPRKAASAAWPTACSGCVSWPTPAATTWPRTAGWKRRSRCPWPNGWTAWRNATGRLTVWIRIET